MITLASAELALSVARGLIKLEGRIDRLLSEKTALQSGLVLALPPIEFGAGPNKMIGDLQKHLGATSDAEPGPLGADRADLASLLKRTDPGLDELRHYYALVFPESAVRIRIDPNEAYLKFLRSAAPSVGLDDADARQAAFFAAAFTVDPGADKRQLSYPVRLGLLVVDVLAEFGAENTQLFVRHEGLRSVVQSVLERFAEPDLESFEQWSPFLRRLLNATVQGALDARDAWDAGNPWLGALLDALVAARTAAGGEGDNFLAGLLRGHGYRDLVAGGLGSVATLLEAGQAGPFGQIAADLLKAAQPLVAARPAGFGAFFNEHWADLLGAGLASLQKHGSVLVEGAHPILREVLLASVQVLAETQGTKLLPRETLFHLGDAILGAVVTHEELIQNGIDQEWLRAVLGSVMGVVRNQGIQRTFTRDGLHTILREAAGVLSAHPELLVKDTGIFRTLVGNVLKEFHELDALDARTLAEAAVRSGLEAVAAHPQLLGTQFAEAMREFASLLAARVREHSLTALQAASLVSAAAQAALRHPELFGKTATGLPGIVLNALLTAAANDPQSLLRGDALVELAQRLLALFAQRGRDKVETMLPELEAKLAEVVEAGLARAAKELGRILDRNSLPATLALLVSAWLQDRIAVVDPDAPAFKKLFADLAGQVPIPLLP